MSRNPIKDKVAFAGVGSTGFFRDANARSRLDLALEACIKAIEDSGLGKEEINGVVGTAPQAHLIASSLGLPEVTHHSNQPMPLVFGVTDAMNAIFSGSADAVLLYHALYRAPAISAGRRPGSLPPRSGFRGVAGAGQDQDRPRTAERGGLRRLGKPVFL